MLCLGFEPTISASEQAKTFHALDRAATVIGNFSLKKSCTFTMLNVCVCLLRLMSKCYITNLASDIFRRPGVYFDIHKT
jgi:hypothetical protein